MNTSALQTLNRMLVDTNGPRQQLYNAAMSLVTAGTEETGPLLHQFFAEGPCIICTSSLDGRGRSQRSIRVYGKKINFRPWHIMWIAINNKFAPTNLQYSHRCHNENCINPDHGLWETDQLNKDRNGCKNTSHVILPDDRVIQVCPHNPPCLTPVHIKDWNDKRVYN